MPGVVVVRDAEVADMAAVAAIYAHYVTASTATFEEIPPTPEDLAERREATVLSGLPYLVAEVKGHVAGYSYACAYRSRTGYRYTVEDSVFVHAGLRGMGIGYRLLAELISRCERGPWRQMIAVIGDGANTASLSLHRKLGFRSAGTLAAVGFKCGRWVDTVLMQRALGAGAGTPAC